MLDPDDPDFAPRCNARRLATRVLALAGSLALASNPAHAVAFSGSAALTSDYVWRGSTQTQGDPAVQAGVKLAGDAGFYGSDWASNVDFGAGSDADGEVDLVVGWSGAPSPAWALDVNLTRYRYPGTRADLDWTELSATATWRERAWLQLAQSNDALASDGRGTYAQLGARFPIGDAFRLEAAVGRYVLDEAADDGYAHAQLSGIWEFRAPFELRVTAHDTDASAKRLFPGAAGGRVEVALQAAF